MTEKDTKYCRFDLTKIPQFGIIAVENKERDSIEGESGLQTTLVIILERWFYDTLY